MRHLKFGAGAGAGAAASPGGGAAASPGGGDGVASRIMPEAYPRHTGNSAGG